MPKISLSQCEVNLSSEKPAKGKGRAGPHLEVLELSFLQGKEKGKDKGKSKGKAADPEKGMCSQQVPLPLRTEDKGTGKGSQNDELTVCIRGFSV